MKIILDENIPFWEKTFATLGEVERYPGRLLSAQHLQGADALIVRSVTPVNAELLQSNTSVKFVGSCTIGCDHIDQSYLESAGIPFANAAGCNANAVAEYALAALLTTLMPLGRTLQDEVVGIVGFGHVGQALYRKMDTLGVNVLINDPPLQQRLNDSLYTEQSPATADLDDVLLQKGVELEILLTQSTIICLHTPLTSSGECPTHHLIHRDNIGKIRPGSLLLNAGRGEVIATDALHTRNDLHLLLDVWENEPHIDSRLIPKVVIGTPHIAGYSWLGKYKGTEMVFDALCQTLSQTLHQTLHQTPFVQSKVDLNQTCSRGIGAVEAPKQIIDVSDCLLNANDRLGANNFWAFLADIVQRVYSIRADDIRFREACFRNPSAAEGTAEDALIAGKGCALTPFDQLRKHYRPRLEWGQVELKGLDQVELSWRQVLRRLGFGSSS